MKACAIGHPDDDGPLDQLAAFIAKYVIFETVEQLHAVALWIAHTHAFGYAETTPRLSIQSAEKQSGKTRLLEVLAELVNAPMQLASISPAAMFRLIDAGLATLLIDEIDTIYGPRAKGSEDLRGLINAGYRRGASVARVVGKVESMKVQKFGVFAPVALAGIGTLPDTIQDRSITVRLKRCRKTDAVAKFRRRTVMPEAEALRNGVSAWVEANGDGLEVHIPSVPDQLPDRAADIWEPLLSIADIHGGNWPALSRRAAIRLSEPLSRDQSQAVLLLRDIKSLFDAGGSERRRTTEMLGALKELEQSPWGEWLTPRKLASMLDAFDIKPHAIRSGPGDVFKGYEASQFHDAWQRYLTPADQSGYTVTSVTDQEPSQERCNPCNPVTADNEAAAADIALLREHLGAQDVTDQAVERE